MGERSDFVSPFLCLSFTLRLAAFVGNLFVKGLGKAVCAVVVARRAEEIEVVLLRIDRRLNGGQRRVGDGLGGRPTLR